VFNRVRHKFDSCLRSTGLNCAASRFFLPSRRQKNDPEKISEAKRILVIKPDGIGDVVLATGFLRSIRQRCPRAHITIAVRRPSRELVDHRCFGDEIMIWDEAWYGLYSSPKALVNLVASARAKWKANPLDWVLIPRSGWDFANASMYAWWSGSPNICVHEYFCADQGLRRHDFANHLVPSPMVTHETEFHRRMLQFLKSDSEAQPQIEIPVSSLKKISELLLQSRTSSKKIALGIGASHDSKRWPAENFKTLAQNLNQKWPDAEIFLIGGDDNHEIARLIKDGLDGIVFDTTGKLSLLETAALLKECEIFIGNDSGPIHLAGAVGCAVVEISKHPIAGDSNHECSPVRFGPIAKWSCVLQPEAQEPECQKGCNKIKAHCITAITVDQVMDKIFQAFAAGLAKR
jgi:ADP-heptose:LPS heptosyltransferase